MKIFPNPRSAITSVHSSTIYLSLTIFNWMTEGCFHFVFIHFVNYCSNPFETALHGDALPRQPGKILPGFFRWKKKSSIPSITCTFRENLKRTLGIFQIFQIKFESLKIVGETSKEHISFRENIS